MGRSCYRGGLRKPHANGEADFAGLDSAVGEKCVTILNSDEG